MLLKVRKKKVEKYKSVNSRRPRENIGAFIERVRKESLIQQTVKIGSCNVIFGIEGPIVFSGKEKFQLVSATVENGKWGKYHILYYPNLKDLISRDKTFLRLDSGCFSGMILGDQTCDCLYQLRRAQKIILKKGGIIIHIPGHDGRGWGEFKMANQRIMDECRLDTISAASSFFLEIKMLSIEETLKKPL